MRNNVALFLPYFGKLPSYFPFFIKSLEAQPVTVFIISDSDYDDGLPENCKWIKTTLQETKSLIEKKLNIKTNIKSGYKLCDFKPMYGEIFSDYLVDFDFWGNIDPDIILGNFDAFITDGLLDTIDFYSGVKEYVSGSFFLMRNEYEFNQLWRKSKDALQIISSSQNFAFDECCGWYYAKLKAGKSIFDCNTPLQSFTEIIKLEETLGLRACFKNTILEPKGFKPVHISETGISYRGINYLILHLLYFKTRFYFFIPNKLVSLRYVNSFGFFNYKPRYLGILFSINFWVAIKKKILINFNKFKS